MGFDLIFKLSRRALPISLYKAISRSIFGRNRQWTGIAMPQKISEYYLSQGLDARNKIVIEVGGGDQIFTALFFLSWGATKVILVDPVIGKGRNSWVAVLGEFNRATGKNLEINILKEKIECYEDLSKVPEIFNGKIGLICSHFSLEHFRDLSSFFVQNQRLLLIDGRSHNRIDLSDHTYHVFSKYQLLKSLSAKRSLYHLRYSDRMFTLLNDPKCYMNRKMIPDYVELSKKFGLIAECKARNQTKNFKVHFEILERYPHYSSEDFQVIDFSLDLRLS